MTERICPTCPTCGHPWPTEPTEARLATWCRDGGHSVSADGAVNEDVAAAILERSPATLTNWRAQGIGPVFHRRGRVRYRLVDLAAFLDDDRNE